MANTGVLTFINTLNYGAELQALALVHVINQLGYEAELVNYICPAVAKRETPRLPKISSLAKPKSFIGAIKKYPMLKKRMRAFNEFTKAHLLVGEQAGGTEDILSRYQRVVVGSDQVWCPQVTGEDATYLLEGNRRTGQKIISYAASFGDKPLPKELCAVFSKHLKHYDALSVRERSGLMQLEELGIEHAVMSIDPTLLLNENEWLPYLDIKQHPKRYVFAYMVSESKQTREFALKAAKELDAELLYIEGYSGMPFRDARNVGACSPAEFLGLIRGASLVVTSSFHGLCFSILFNRPFRYVLSADKDHSRLYSLLRELGLEHYDAEEDNLNDSVDFTLANQKLAEMRKKSISYLREALT